MRALQEKSKVHPAAVAAMHGCCVHNHLYSPVALVEDDGSILERYEWSYGPSGLTRRGAVLISVGMAHPTKDCTPYPADWKARYGDDICKGCNKGDLPCYTPPGKKPYEEFLKKSECEAWRKIKGSRSLKFAQES